LQKRGTKKKQKIEAEKRNTEGKKKAESRKK
jgi:hypothetical protein